MQFQIYCLLSEDEMAAYIPKSKFYTCTLSDTCKKQNDTVYQYSIQFRKTHKYTRSLVASLRDYIREEFKKQELSLVLILNGGSFTHYYAESCNYYSGVSLSYPHSIWGNQSFLRSKARTLQLLGV